MKKIRKKFKKFLSSNKFYKKNWRAEIFFKEKIGELKFTKKNLREAAEDPRCPVVLPADGGARGPGRREAAAPREADPAAATSVERAAAAARC